MYIAKIPNRNSHPAFLLRESYRENGKVRNRTLANLTCLPEHSIEALKRSLKGERLFSANDFEIVEDGSPAHGHVEAVMTAMKRLKFSNLISARSSRERDLVVAMIAARILEPKSKLATSLWWQNTTLPEIMNVSDADEDDLYNAMDWLLDRQKNIEANLAKRHLEEKGMALYDLSSSYFEGKTCPLAKYGHNRDRKKGKLQINYGLLTNRKGIPVSVSVFEGNTSDSKTLIPQILKIRTDFNIKQFVLVGDRGMLTQKKIDTLRGIDGADWIGALRPEAIKKLIIDGPIQLSLFDEHNLFEVEHPDFPGERLVACRNLAVAKKRERSRQSLLDATSKELDKIKKLVSHRRLHGKDEISAQVQAILKSYRIGKHFKVCYRDDGFDYTFDESTLKAEITAKSRGDKALFAKRMNRVYGHVKSITNKLTQINKKITEGKLYGKDKIGVRVGKVINKKKVGKHFKLTINDNEFSYEIDQAKVKHEAALDGIYIIRTSLAKKDMDAEEAVRSYKKLSQVEQAFRAFKSVDLMVRPIRHRLDRRVRAHIFLCMLAYYVQKHMMEAWRPLTYADEEQYLKEIRDPVAPAERSSSAKQKAYSKQLDDGSAVYSFRGLLNHLGSIVRATCRCPGEEIDSPTFSLITNPNPKQQKAFDLLKTINL